VNSAEKHVTDFVSERVLKAHAPPRDRGRSRPGWSFEAPAPLVASNDTRISRALDHPARRRHVRAVGHLGRSRFLNHQCENPSSENGWGLNSAPWASTLVRTPCGLRPFSSWRTAVITLDAIETIDLEVDVYLEGLTFSRVHRDGQRKRDAWTRSNPASIDTQPLNLWMRSNIPTLREERPRREEYERRYPLRLPSAECS
jgi:hypothetical protein